MSNGILNSNVGTLATGNKEHCKSDIVYSVCILHMLNNFTHYELSVIIISYELMHVTLETCTEIQNKLKK